MFWPADPVALQTHSCVLERTQSAQRAASSDADSDGSTSSATADVGLGHGSDSGNSEDGDEDYMSTGTATKPHEQHQDFMDFMGQDAVYPVQPRCMQTVVGAHLHDGLACLGTCCGIMLCGLLRSSSVGTVRRCDECIE